MKTLTFKEIDDYVHKNDYVILIFTTIGQNYVSVCLKHKTGNRKNKPDKPLKGRIYDEESFRVLYKIYQTTKPMRFRYINHWDVRYECLYFFVEGLEPHLQMGGEIDKEFFTEAIKMYKKQFEILKQVFQ